MPYTPTHVKGVSPQKLFGFLGGCIHRLIPALSQVTVCTKKQIRAKPKKNTGLDHVLQAAAAKLCSHQSLYRMRAEKTPKTLKKLGIQFLEKSTHYDNIPNINTNTIWTANASMLAHQTRPMEQLTVMLDLTPDEKYSKKYEARRKGYVGRNKKGEPITDYCHQIASVTLAGFKQFLYALRLPGNYNAFSNPIKHRDTKLAGLNFFKKIAYQLAERVHALYPNKRFLWLFDRGFDEQAFWHWLKQQGDDFITALDKTSACIKQAQRLLDLNAVLLQKAVTYSYYQTLVQIDGLNLKAVYIQPHNNKAAYWLVTTKLDWAAETIKKKYNERSGDEPLFDYLKNDFNARKPCKKSFAGAQAHLALLCLAHNIVSLLSHELFNTYHRVQTLTAMIIEAFALEHLFQALDENESQDFTLTQAVTPDVSTQK